MGVCAEQHAAIWFCVRLSKTLAKTHDLMRQTHDDECLGKMTMKRWHRDYAEGWKIVGLTPHGGIKPCHYRCEHQYGILLILLQWMKANMGSHDHLKVDSILHWFPHQPDVWTNGEKLWCLLHKPRENCQKSRLLMCHHIDESWVHYFDPLTKREKEWVLKVAWWMEEGLKTEVG